jgi:Zn-dependent protease with chaperone function
MNGPIIVAAITAIAGVFATALAFYLTRQKEREADWRSQKLAHYKAFMVALNAIVGPPASTEEKIAFANAANNLFLVGSPAVLIALRRYLDETAESNTDKAFDRHDEYLTELIFAIRDDIGLKPNRPNEPFEFRLWAGKPRV